MKQKDTTQDKTLYTDGGINLHITWALNKFSAMSKGGWNNLIFSLVSPPTRQHLCQIILYLCKVAFVCQLISSFVIFFMSFISVFIAKCLIITCCWLICNYNLRNHNTLKIDTWTKMSFNKIYKVHFTKKLLKINNNFNFKYGNMAKL